MRYAKRQQPKPDGAAEYAAAQAKAQAYANQYDGQYWVSMNWNGRYRVDSAMDFCLRPELMQDLALCESFQPQPQACAA